MPARFGSVLAVLGFCAACSTQHSLDDVQTLEDIDLAEGVERSELGSTQTAETPIFRSGVFGELLSRPAALSDDVTPGAPLAFGTMGRACGVRGRALGQEVDRFPDKRRAAYKLYDTASGSTETRAFFITGFSDGCPRQVTAANAVFGAPSMHERLRYGLPADTLPASVTDEAYKRLKARVCRVRRDEPCGARIETLEANTVFVTMYRSFSGNQSWSNVLLHDGEVYASDIKQRP